MIIYFSIALVFYIGALIWQYMSKGGLIVFDLLTFFMASILWLPISFIGGILWVVSSDFMKKRIGGGK